MSQNSGELLSRPDTKEKPISFEGFVRYLLAGVKLNGVDYIDIRKDNHQTAFGKVYENFNARDNPHLRVRRDYPTAVTGKYPRLDREIISLQGLGITHVVGPDFKSIELTMTESRAQRTIERLPELARVELLEVAEEFVEELRATY